MFHCVRIDLNVNCLSNRLPNNSNNDKYNNNTNSKQPFNNKKKRRLETPSS